MDTLGAKLETLASIYFGRLITQSLCFWLRPLALTGLGLFFLNLVLIFKQIFLIRKFRFNQAGINLNERDLFCWSIPKEPTYGGTTVSGSAKTTTMSLL